MKNPYVRKVAIGIISAMLLASTGAFAELVRQIADVAALLQQGRISTYLTYSFITLIALLVVVL